MSPNIQEIITSVEQRLQHVAPLTPTEIKGLYSTLYKDPTHKALFAPRKQAGDKYDPAFQVYYLYKTVRALENGLEPIELLPRDSSNGAKILTARVVWQRGTHICLQNDRA